MRGPPRVRRRRRERIVETHDEPVRPHDEATACAILGYHSRVVNCPLAAPQPVVLSLLMRQAVLIMTDTQRTDMLGCYGGPLSTPQLDAFAASAVRYDRAYTTQPVCGPARSALFTVYFPHSNGAWGNGMALQEHAVTIGSRLERIGLHTGYVGKWHLDGFDYFGLGSCPPGWDPAYWYDMRNYLEDLSPEDRARSRDPATNRTGVPAEFTFANRVTELARAFIRNHSAED